ncbi:response regulator [Microbacteriaceae bacterium K1510]|nr:response regulator [Microbacteriaceae bacterium K1510]
MIDRKPYVAVVDDDASVRTAIARLLVVNSYSAEAFGSALEFLGSLAKRTPECIVLDLQMPELDGLELQLRMQREGIRIPTVIITAHNEPGLQERCSSAGATAFLVKPVLAAALMTAIDDAVAMQ